MEGEPKNLEPPNHQHVLAAVGWLELGNPSEAAAELERVASEFQDHPHVLRLRCEILGHQKQWGAVLETAETLVARAPQDAYGWINRSNALHFLGRYQEAYDRLFPALEQFPRNAELRYNLACFCCRMNRLPEAREWLAQAFRIDSDKRLKPAALADPDLEPLWPEISELA